MVKSSESEPERMPSREPDAKLEGPAVPEGPGLPTDPGETLAWEAQPSPNRTRPAPFPMVPPGSKELIPPRWSDSPYDDG